MAKINKLQAAFDAFANKDQNAATKLFREFFVENARVINRKMERQLNEEFGGDQEEDLFNDVDAEDGNQEDAGFDGFDDESNDEGFGGGYEEDEDAGFGQEDQAGQTEEVKITPEQADNINTALADLKAIMAELGGDEDEFGSDEDEGFDAEEDSLQFGDEPAEEDEDGLQESFQMKSVKTPDMKEQGDVNTKSPVAKVQSPFGIKGTNQEFKSSTAKGTNDKLDTSVPSSKDENFSNVNANGKSVYKKATEKKVKQPEGQENNQSILKDFRGKK